MVCKENFSFNVNWENNLLKKNVFQPTPPPQIMKWSLPKSSAMLDSAMCSTT